MVKGEKYMEEKKINLTHDFPLARDTKVIAEKMYRENAKYDLEQYLGKVIIEEINLARNRGKMSTFVSVECVRCKSASNLVEEDLAIVYDKIQGLLRTNGFKVDYFYKYEMNLPVIFHISWDDN